MNFRKLVLPVIMVVLCSPVLASAISNLVVNGDLETGSSAPQGWSTDKWGTNTTTFTYPAGGKDGSKGAKVQMTKRTSGDAKWMFNHIPATPGKTYTYSDNYNSNVSTTITIEYKKSNGSYSYVWLGNVSQTGGAWNTYTKQFKAPSGVVSMSVMHLIQSVGALTIDNVSVTDGSAPPPPPPTDVCPNVPGDQTATPCADVQCVNQGGTWNGSSCNLPPPADVCPNLDGAQATVPSGYQLQNGQCVLIPPPSSPGSFSEGMVSFSFDDSWLSQYTTALPILEAAGIKGTFYLTTEPIQEGWDDFITPAEAKDYATRGHEIGGHTVTHADLTTISSSKRTKELVDSKNYLQNLTGVAVTTLAYPYGAYNSTVITAARDAGYSNAREIDAESLNLTSTNKFALKALLPERNTSMSSVKAEIDKAKANKQWLVLGWHEIKNGGDQYSNTPAQLQEIVDYVKAVSIKTVTIKEGTALMTP